MYIHITYIHILQAYGILAETLTAISEKNEPGEHEYKETIIT